MEKIIDECYQKSIGLLLKNSTKFGVLASSKSDKAIDRNYLSIFGRDASICALGMIASKNKDLINISKKSLLTHVKYQANNGQIPNYVKPEKKEIDWWYFGCIDATLWWLIAVNFYIKNSGDKSFENKIKLNIKIALEWLNAQKHNQDGLIMQNEASDWADNMPRSGKVLYSNALWLKVIKEYKLPGYKKVKNNFNCLFYPFNIAKSGVEIPKRNLSLINFIGRYQKSIDHYLSYVNYRFWGEDIDVYANSLTIILGISDKDLNKKIVKEFLARNKNKNFPMPVLFNPINKNAKNWREYMKIHQLDFPYQYHNGGIWPFASAFWAMALNKAGYKKEAWKEMEKIAKANKINNWQFNEWFHGKTGKPMGMSGQSWNAGVFLLAYHYLKSDIKF